MFQECGKCVKFLLIQKLLLSQGSDCGDGLLHRAHDHRSSSTVSLSSDTIAGVSGISTSRSTDEQLDHLAVAGGVSVWSGSKISNP
jgi:hypothetical protein